MFRTIRLISWSLRRVNDFAHCRPLPGGHASPEVALNNRATINSLSCRQYLFNRAS